MRVRQGVLLAVASARAVPWVPFLVAGALATAGLLPAAAGAAAPASQVWALRIAAVLLGAGACFAVVEPMTLVAVTPAPRFLRQWLRIAVVLLPATAVWTALYGLAAATLPEALPWRSLAVEALTCVAAGMAGASLAARAGHTPTTAIAGPAVQGVLLAGSFFLPAARSPWLLPAAPHWHTSRTTWQLTLLACALLLLAANRETWPLIRRPAAVRRSGWVR